MSLWELFRYSVSDLLYRWITAAMNVAAVGISVVYVLVLGFYAVSTHRYQQRVVEESGPAEKIVVTTPSVTDPEQWFTPQRIDELKRMPGVRGAFVCVEQNIDISLDGRQSLWVPLESTAPGDPTTSPHRMVWGQSVSGLDRDEVILGKTLFQKLGGTVTAQKPAPDTLTICLKRTRNGVEEVQRRQFRIVGLLGHQPSDRIYLPAGSAVALDSWLAHRTSALDAQGSPTHGLRFPFCYGYVPEEEGSRVADECRRLGTTAERLGDIETYDPDEPVTFVQPSICNPSNVWSDTRSGRRPKRPARSMIA